MTKAEIINILQSDIKLSDEVLNQIGDLVDLRKSMRNEIMTNGSVICPVCNTKSTRYKRKLNKGMYFFLLHLSSKWHKGDWIYYDRVKTEVAGKYQTNPTDYSKLAVFNLIELRKEKDDTTGISNGEVTITNFGWDFIRGKASIPKYVYMIHNQVVGFSDEKIFFNECQDKFKLKDIYDGE